MEPARSAPADHGAADAVLGRLPPRLRRVADGMLSRWPGRIALRSVSGCIRIELFDRSMTIAGQFFTSVFPILVSLAAWSDRDDSEWIADAIDMPEESRSVLSDAVGGSTSATFGLLGILIVLISATSLSRALTRAFAAIWRLERPKTRLAFVWRWLAVVLALALSLVVVRAIDAVLEDAAASTVLQAMTAIACDLAVAVFVPWILLQGAIPPRQLVPGALLFALAMVVVRPGMALWLPRSLEVSADRYGTIGVAFTYLAWLYVLSFCFLTASVIGQVVASDPGRFGQWIRGADKAGAAPE
jgi:uncharacterized BrkB/YihY/UPF0761 family membrane protein